MLIGEELAGRRRHPLADNFVALDAVAEPGRHAKRELSQLLQHKAVDVADLEEVVFYVGAAAAVTDYTLPFLHSMIRTLF